MTTVDDVELHTLAIPTPAPESDGTIEWTKTELVIVEVAGGGERGLGWTYASAASAAVVRDVLADCVRGADVFASGAVWDAMVARCRNLGRPGAAMMAISAVDVALWDLKARLLKAPLASLLGRIRDRVPIYGSGGFTSYDERALKEELGNFVRDGVLRVKMKVGRDPAADPTRVAWARQAIGDDASLFVDANGAYTRQQAARLAHDFAAQRVSWLEEPVSSDDLAGLRWLRDRVPHGMEIAAGEYGFDPWYFHALVAADAVDVVQIDATRAGGVTGFLRAAAVADAAQLPVSSHCAPNLHAHIACATPRFVHAEFFVDHARIEPQIFDGALSPTGGALVPDLSRAGHGLRLKRKEAARHAA
jgi:L-alanine-DL-glutamate epimerase-like enolase superfamily enzyme